MLDWTCWPAVMKLFKSHNGTLYWLRFLFYFVILSFQDFVRCTNTYLSSHMWLRAAVHGRASEHLTSMETRAGNSAQWAVPLRGKVEQGRKLHNKDADWMAHSWWVGVGWVRGLKLVELGGGNGRRRSKSLKSTSSLVRVSRRIIHLFIQK